MVLKTHYLWQTIGFDETAHSFPARAPDCVEVGFVIRKRAYIIVSVYILNNRVLFKVLIVFPNFTCQYNSKTSSTLAFMISCNLLIFLHS